MTAPGPRIEWRDNLGATPPPEDHQEWRDAIRAVSGAVRVVFSRRGAGAWFMLVAEEPSDVLGGAAVDRRRDLIAALRAAEKTLTND